MWFDPDNPVMALCASGMQVDGEPEKARALFEQAWAARRDDFDASVAAHFLARHQGTPGEILRWNAIALEHADRVPAERAAALIPSLCLNLADSHFSAGHLEPVDALLERGCRALESLPPDDGYTQFVRMGLERLRARLRTARRS